ncbi:MAG TPA: DNRLRE domain-containing protein [Chthoniobacteraceae bacterium]|jgi:hypothetical protein|nr:DNRLRE domain-containing protein [Chthoniobacteraceae bacterium]
MARLFRESRAVASDPKNNSFIRVGLRAILEVSMKFTIVSVGLLLGVLARLNAVEATLMGDISVSSAPNALKPLGNAPILRISETDTTFLHFDIQSVLPEGTTAQQIGKATLRIWLHRVEQAGMCGVFAVTSSWDEFFFLHDPPSIGDLVALGHGGRSQTFAVFDVTDLVRRWLSGTPNRGMALSTHLPFVYTDSVPPFLLKARIDSKENTGTGHLPTLQIVLAN